MRLLDCFLLRPFTYVNGLEILIVNNKFNFFKPIHEVYFYNINGRLIRKRIIKNKKDLQKFIKENKFKII